MRTHYLAVGIVTIGAILTLWGIKQKKLTPHYSLSVSFAGHTNLDVGSSEQASLAKRFGMTLEPGLHNFGNCVLLAVTNNDNERLQFHSRAVEYEIEGRWHEIHPQRWTGLQGLRWLPGLGRTLAVSIPPEVPATARWRIRLVCALDLSIGRRATLNQLARRYSDPDSLAFYSPAAQWTVAIPPQPPNPAVQRAGAGRSADKTNPASVPAGSRR